MKIGFNILLIKEKDLISDIVKATCECAAVYVIALVVLYHLVHCNFFSGYQHHAHMHTCHVRFMHWCPFVLKILSLQAYHTHETDTIDEEPNLPHAIGILIMCLNCMKYTRKAENQIYPKLIQIREIECNTRDQ